MSQQTNQQLPAISVEKIESLKQLPVVLTNNQELLTNAKKGCEPVLAKIQNFNFKEADLTETDKLEAQINELQVKIRKAKEIAEGRRKPGTAVMDEIKALFTSNEREYDFMFSQFKNFRDLWQAEKNARNQQAEKEKQKKLAEASERVNYSTAAASYFMKRLFEIIASRKKAMNDQFQTVNLSNIDKFDQTYREWVPSLMQKHIDFIQAGFVFQANFLTTHDQSNLFFEAFNKAMKELEKEYVDQMTAEKNRILEIVPAKKKELELIAAAPPEQAQQIQQQANARDQEEQKRQAELLKQQEQEKVTNIATNAQSQSVAGMFGIMAGSSAAPVANVSKGTKQKKAIKVTNQAGWLAILQVYGLKRVPSGEMESLEKELKSVLKWATEYLNGGGELPASDGIQIENVFSTTAKAAK